MLIITAGAVSTSLAHPDLLDLPIRHLLKDELHASQSQMAMLFGIGALAWYVKPFAGLLVCCVIRNASAPLPDYQHAPDSCALASPRSRFAFLFLSIAR